ncbi:protein shuttle craft [Battus philenor]|uniref:protein shuttle craft n=1 Tax=Battus philenor TaxID=42288 RepID=UPI0035CFB06A
MSQWNNSYAYNNQFQGPPNGWNGDLNGQYVNQPYYGNRQFESGNQYVSFEEFLTQIQGNSVPQNNAPNYTNLQYQTYPSNQYNYQNIPSQNADMEYNYGASTSNGGNNMDTYQVNMQNQYNPVLADTTSYNNEIVTKSKLTPTATEFVPKSSLHAPSTSQNTSQESQITNNGSSDSRSSTSKSSESNWRERPSNSDSSKPQVDTNSFSRFQKNKNSETNNRNREYSSRYDNKRNNEANQETNGRYRNSNNSYNSNNHNFQSNSSQNNETESQATETYTNQNDRNLDSGNRNENKRHTNDNNQTKSSKSKNKDNDAGRTFYNSTISKNSQDVRNGRGESSGRQRNWVGSQRVRTVDRNFTEDEQYANTYMQYKDERVERIAKFEKPASPNRGKAREKNTSDSAGNTTAMTQRERLTDQLDRGTLECLVCCERVKQTDSVWWCSNCYHVLHLRCIRKWAMSSLVEGKWRCPACQNTSEEIPTEYRCMCGAVKSPEYSRGTVGAHTCGKACRRPRNCPHPCTLLCHPGPCPPCQATISKQCGCGAETRSVLCSSKLPQLCGRECKRKLACRVHKCQKECHEGSCDDCSETVTQVCHCPAAKSRSVPCTSDTGTCATWSCGSACARVLSCGAHVCRRVCHEPPCAPCPLRPDNVRTCPCGNTKIRKDQRKSCTDPIPLCGNICAKPLPCGPEGDKHFCKQLCHEGPCQTCPDKTSLPCRCGHSSREVPCSELPEMSNNVLCQKKCNKKLSCGRHRCRTVCCAAQSHRCAVVCGRTLSCQLHRCEEFCHTGHCAPCPRVSFVELHCECGAEVLLPPVRCGTRPPVCHAPCRRERPCQHPPHHACHTGDCPPCVVLTTKMCHGQHEERKTIPCSQEEFSCGLPCGKPLPCGKHTCTKTCHKGPCDTDKCRQACTEKRASCGHACAAPCHVDNGGACPSNSPCKKPVRATCPCGRRTAERTCYDNSRDYAKMMSALAATKMQEGGSVDLSDVQRPGAMLKTLECDDECRMEARCRQLALALQIRNPDVSAKLAPRYSEHVRTMAAREPAFASHVHDCLSELVQRAKKSKQKTRAHSFPSMNRQKRQFIHELCEHFGCESVAYDAEPNRNVVATADREKSWLPAMSVLEVLAREAGKRRVPGPVLRAPATATSTAPAATPTTTTSRTAGGWATLTSTNAWASRSQPRANAEPKIDYFDNPPDN